MGCDLQYLSLLSDMDSSRAHVQILMRCIPTEAQYLPQLGWNPQLENLTMLQMQASNLEEIYEGLAMLGLNDDFEALAELHLAVGGAHAKRALEWEAGTAISEQSALLQGPAAAALRHREDDVRRREEDLAAREAALQKREQELGALVVASPRVVSPTKQSADIAGVLVEDEDLRELFNTYDQDGSGYVSRSEFKEEYRTFEDFGLPLTEKQLDRIFSQFGGNDDRLSYEEFCILMLQRARI